MPELDDLLTGDLARGVAADARPPAFETVARRGRARRRRRTLGALTGVVLAVAGAGIAVETMSGGGQRPPVAPEPVPTIPEPDPDETTGDHGPAQPGAEEIVDHPDSRLVDVVVSVEDPDIVLSLWSLCRDPVPAPETRGGFSCGVSDQAAVLVRPGQDRVLVGLPSRADHIEALPGGDFWLDEPRRGRILRADGSIVEIRRGGTIGPLAPGEILVGRDAVAPDSGTAHPIVPRDEVAELRQTAGGQLRMLAYPEDVGEVTYSWSDDGGATWSSEELTSDDNSLFGILPTAADDVHAVQAGGDGATLFPVGEFFVSTDGGATFERRPGTSTGADGPMAYGTGQMLADGRMLLDVEGWSDQDLRKPGSGTPSGLYVSRGEDWSAYDPLPLPGEPDDQHPGSFRLLPGATPEKIRLVAIDPESSVAYLSTDLGEGWEPLPTGRG